MSAAAELAESPEGGEDQPPGLVFQGDVPHELSEHAAELHAAVGLAVDVHGRDDRSFIVVRAVPLPAGTYSVPRTDLLMIAEAQYPMAAMDMFWTTPDVLLADGTEPASATEKETYIGLVWRRFSWHRNSAWSPNRNGLLDHFEFSLARLAGRT